jgi:hypothetical protein
VEPEAWKKGDSKMRCQIRYVLPAVVIAATLVLASGCSKAERQEAKAEHQVKKEERKMDRDADYRDHEWNEAVKYANKGYTQLNDFDNKLAEVEPDRAKRHLEKASKDFSDALTHLAKSEVGKDRQAAIDDLNSGVDALNKAYKELDEGRIDSAQSHYDKANEYFAKAADILQ